LWHAVKVTTATQATSDAHVPLTEWKLNRDLEARRKDQREEQERESRSLIAGWIYYIRVDERIKIGYSTDVKQRMRAYPPHSELLAVHPGTPTLEREMHAQFAGHLAQGREWFRPDDPVMVHIARVVEQFGPPPKSFIYRFRDGTTQRIKPHARSRR